MNNSNDESIISVGIIAELSPTPNITSIPLHPLPQYTSGQSYSSTSPLLVFAGRCRRRCRHYRIDGENFRGCVIYGTVQYSPPSQYTQV